MAELIQMPDLTENGFISSNMVINNQTYKFVIRWSHYSQCAFLDISLQDELLVEDFAMVTNGIIRIDKRKLPELKFRHIDDLTIEPIKQTFSNYVIEYE